MKKWIYGLIPIFLIISSFSLSAMISLNQATHYGLEVTGTANVTQGVVAARFVGNGSRLTGVLVSTAGMLEAALVTGSITSAKILDGTILAGDMATGSVTSRIILDGTILAADINTSAVTSTKILDRTILSGDIATGAVTTTEILNGTITNEDVSTGSFPTITGVGLLGKLQVTAKITGNITGTCDGLAGSVAASNITGTTLPAAIVGSSLTSVGNITNLSVTGSIKALNSDFCLSSNTIDGSDSSAISMCGGGGFGAGNSRGASIKLYGNENASAGLFQFLPGNVNGGTIRFYTGSGSLLSVFGLATDKSDTRATFSGALYGVGYKGSGSITISGNVSAATASFSKSVFGEYVVTYNLSLTQIALTSAYVTVNAPMTVGTDIALRNITQGSGYFTVNSSGGAGEYEIRIFGNIDKLTDGDDIEGGVSINGADPKENCEFRMDGALSGYNAVQSVKTLLLAVGDRIAFKLKNVTASRNIIPKSFTFSVRKPY